MSEFAMMMGLAYGLQAIGAIILFSIFFDVKIKRYLCCVITVFIYVILWFTYYPGKVASNMIGLTVGNLIIAMLCFEGDIKYKSMLTVLYTGCITIGEIIVLNVVEYIYIDYSITDTNVVVIALASKLLIIIIEITIKHKLNCNLRMINNKQFAIYVISMVFIIANLYSHIDITIRHGNSTVNSLVMTFLSFGLMICVVLMFQEFCDHAKVQDKVRENALMMQKMNNDLKNYEQMKNSYEQIRMIKHDLPKHMEIIRGYARKNDAQDILNYIDNYSMNIEEVINRADTGSAALNVIMDNMANKAARQGTKLSWHVRCDMGFMQDVDIVSIFSNILDNALESCQRCGGGYIDINVLSVNGNSITIYLENSCIESKQEDGSLPKTIKNDIENHGYGMKSLQAVAAKYKGFVCCTYVEERKVFITEISIPVSL